MTTRQEVIDNARHVATRAMQDKGEVEPMIIAHTADALMAFPLASMMDSPTTKDIAAEMIGVKMREHDASVYVFMSEAWLAVLQPGEDPREGPPPSERPDRIKALVLSASDGDEDTLVMYRTVRNARGRSRH